MGIRKKFLLLIVFVVVGGACLVYFKGMYFFQLRKNPVVVLTAKGFLPSQVVIKRGDTVTFLNEGFDFFWPASNMHPNHSIYLGFDSGKPVPRGESWSFVFDSVGIWDYHDHTKPYFGGTVVVLDDNFRLGKDPSCKDLNALSFEQKQKCWYTEVKKIAEKTGSGEAMNYLSDLHRMDSEFQQHCHDMTHLIGGMAYKEYKNDDEFVFDDRTSYCGYGFYHGFIEALSFDGGDILEVRDFCLGLGSKNIGGVVQPMMDMACFHGIGHAAFDSHDGSIYGSEKELVGSGTKVCRQITKDLDWYYFKQCMTGVYNALGIAYSNEQYGLAMNEDDPTWFCRLEPEETRKYCYAEVVPAWLNEKHEGRLSVENIVDFVKTIKVLEDAQMSVYTSVFEYVKGNAGTEVEADIVKRCFKAQPGLRASCVEGVVAALIASGDFSNEYVRVLNFCRSVSPLLLDGDVVLRKRCFDRSFEGFTNIYSSEKIVSLCSGYTDEKIEICKNII